MAVWLLILLSIAGVWAACGKKAPPRPPEVPQVSPAADLTVQRDGMRVVLDWIVPDEKGRKRVRLARYVILRGRQLQEDCADCPIAFKPVAEMEVDSYRRALDELPGHMRYIDAPGPGATYFYKVSAFSEGGRELGTSKTVSIVLK